jgi:hypothetical protein
MTKQKNKARAQFLRSDVDNLLNDMHSMSEEIRNKMTELQEICPCPEEYQEPFMESGFRCTICNTVRSSIDGYYN